jgi:alkanesulfonate monooxygenase SsuD/methylene tetrahydromethanopterin reductase-like flavin-dependent oxidoreductase (luciferase family)
MAHLTNAVGAERRYWGVIPVLPGQQLMETAKQMEDVGYTGVFAIQVFGPPFIPLSVAAAGTSKLQVATGIAIAGTRSPFETAMAAIDVDRISEGRFILGLGSSAPAWTADIFGTDEYKPIAHLRDTVAAVRHIIAGALKKHVPDEMVETFVACGPLEEVAEAVEPFWQMADSMCPTPPVWGIPQEKVQYYSQALAAFVHSQRS